jgi:hypothetical protein
MIAKTPAYRQVGVPYPPCLPAGKACTVTISQAYRDNYLPGAFVG